MAVNGMAQCPTCAGAVRVRSGRWRCTCGTAGTTLPDGAGDYRLAVTEAPKTLAGIRGRFGVQLLDGAPSVRTM